jgi:hypothetical protein
MMKMKNVANVERKVLARKESCCNVAIVKAFNITNVLVSQSILYPN